MNKDTITSLTQLNITQPSRRKEKIKNQLPNKTRIPWPRLRRLGASLVLALLLATTGAFTLGALLPSKASGQGPDFVYSVASAQGGTDNNLRVIDLSNGTVVSSVTITLAGKTVLRANGLAAHPNTQELWALLKLQGQSGRELVTINPTTGVATSIGDTKDNFAGLAFDSAGTLYGVTGDGANVPETLFTLNTTDATSTPVVALGNGSDGETIAFNPDDGLLYHASGTYTRNVVSGKIFESINLTTTAVTTIPISGPDTKEILAILYVGEGNFLMADRDDKLFYITTGGIVTSTAITLNHSAKGLALVPKRVYLPIILKN